jgi:uracil phosphoribosyltransferase
MIHNLSHTDSLAQQFVAELRDVTIQKDRMRFRRNIERIGEIAAYEISKKLVWEDYEVTTPLGVANCRRLKEQPILATILRAGLPLHQGLLNYFDQADNAFIAAYRKHDTTDEESFTINMEYITSPPLEGSVLILADPMLATGQSIVETLKKLYVLGKPSHTHIVTAIASSEGIAFVKQHLTNITIWAGAIDEELTAKSYIVPGLGDAGDLCFGEKTQF